MDSTLRIASSVVLPISSSSRLHRSKAKLSYGFKSGTYGFSSRICAIPPNGSISSSASSGSSEFDQSARGNEKDWVPKKVQATYSKHLLQSSLAESSSMGDVHRQRSSLESLFCYDKPIPEERIAKPVGLSISKKVIGDNPQCTDCQAKGAVLCTTCSGSGLYVDSILESQGIIVKVRCLGCGGTGNIMCAECGGRGHLGSK